MRDVNKTAILEMIRSEGVVSRSQIASTLNISLSSVVRITDELVKSNFICDSGKSEFSGGRRRPLLKMNDEDNLSISIDLGGTKIYSVLMNLRGNVLFEKEIANHGLKDGEVYNTIRDIIETLIEFSKNTGKKLLGISIGVPSHTNEKTGIVEWAPSLEWKAFPLKQKLEDDFCMTAVVANDVNLAALGETWFGEGRYFSDYVLMSIGTGLGAGIVIDHTVYTGANNMAGEIGYSINNVDFLRKHYPGFGPLETMVSGAGITERAREHLKSTLSNTELSKINGIYVFDACRNGEEWARKIVDDMADYLSMAIASICATINPEVIILGGGISGSADLFIDRVRNNMEYTYSKEVPVKISTLGKKATVLGATIRLYHKLFNYCVIRSWS